MRQRRGQFRGTLVSCLRLSPRVIRGGQARQGVTYCWNAGRFRTPGSPSPFPSRAIQLAQPNIHHIAFFPPQRVRASGALAQAVDDFVAPMCTGWGLLALKASSLRERNIFVLSSAPRCHQAQDSELIFRFSMSRCTVRVARVVHNLHMTRLWLPSIPWGAVNHYLAVFMDSWSPRSMQELDVPCSARVRFPV